jgi:hypothetical protein
MLVRLESNIAVVERFGGYRNSVAKYWLASDQFTVLLTSESLAENVLEMVVKRYIVFAENI